jgi:CBS domain containing-hemolysin-like protein
MLTLTLQRLYSSIPAKELKRLAGRGDHLAAALYRPVAYGTSMRLLLWVVFGLSFTTSVIMLTSSLVTPIAFIVVGLAVVATLLLQSIRLTVHSAHIAVHAAPVLSWLLTYLHTPLAAIANALHAVRTHDAHSGLYEKDDIIALFHQQRDQVDNRIATHDLDILERAAIFNDRQAADIVLPMAKVKLVNKDEPIGPILLKELHDSGQTSFMVYDSTPQRIVGTLFLRDAVAAREGGRVADLVRHKISYVHEDFSLRQVLQAFLRTGQHVVVVINSFEEAVGVITLSMLLSQLFGEADDTGDTQAYDDTASIAAYAPRARRTDDVEESAAPVDDLTSNSTEDTQPDVASPDATEVVE